VEYPDQVPVFHTRLANANARRLVLDAADQLIDAIMASGELAFSMPETPCEQVDSTVTRAVSVPRPRTD
jgi:hypothetical protein